METSQNCFSSMFRKMRGVTVLYCGYYFMPVDMEGTCKEHNKHIKKQ